jgi:hypothetical protein
MKFLVIGLLLTATTIAYAEDEAVPKPAQVCHQNCQPIGPRQVCNKHCWSYRGGPGSVLVQTTVTWSAGPAIALKAKPKPTPVVSKE